MISLGLLHNHADENIKIRFCIVRMSTLQQNTHCAPAAVVPD